MNWYCEKCKKVHMQEDICPRIKEQLRKHPEWLSEAVDFVTVAGQERLITTQALDNVAQEINKIAGTNLTYEGTHQFARDIQVFKRLNEEPFSRSGHFSDPQKAMKYLENVTKTAEGKPGAMTSFEGKLTGYGQEVDWLRYKKGQISSLWEKSSLLENNAPGVDGITINRFTGKEISRTTIKASKNPMTANSTGIRDVKEAIEKGTATSSDIIFGPEGTKQAAADAGLKNPVIEKNSVEQINKSNERLKEKISKGQATTAPTMQQVSQQMAQGAVIGAAVSLTVSTISNFVRYRNGEITVEEAFSEVGEETIKGALVGGAMSGVTLFLPAGPLGFIAGIGVGIYLNAACTNLLDEVFGKGAYGAILNSSGYVYGMTFNLAEYYERIERNSKAVQTNVSSARKSQIQIENNFELFEQMKGE